MTSNEIRAQFLHFFKSKSHQISASSPMVQQNDPTLMFVNAGMVPFKSYFLGQENPKHPRVANSQKCLRVSGKHNDLEEVGKDTYHHTMFEMLGNWSFGDYFKKEAIEWAWELLTDVYKIDKNNLYVTVFEGDKNQGLEYDEEAYDLWKKLIPEDRIINGNKKDNFWEMGAQGPCGPCSEIHIDIRSEEEKRKISGKEFVNKDHPQVVEIWNLVFMEFNRKADRSLEKLKSKHIDTGMGLERLCMVLQNVQSNYDTDVFVPIIEHIAKITQKKYATNDAIAIAMRVVADHLRAVVFAIADGQLPSNNGAGYVIRRILRRAIRYGYSYLDQKEPFIYKLVSTLRQQLGGYYTELVLQENFISNVIEQEEASFLRTLSQGLELLDQVVEKSPKGMVSGKDAFVLYDTFGFPLDLTMLILEEKGLKLNEAEFQAALKQQKNRSKAAAESTTSDWNMINNEADSVFVGYDELTTKVKITRYREVNSKKEGRFFQLVFNKTPFYPAGGGQVGDRGCLTNQTNRSVEIFDTLKENNLIIHLVKKLPENLAEAFEATVDKSQRFASACNHTATHLLHAALRKVLGNHVSQKGSSVHAGGLRFDFSHFSKLTIEELEQVETAVNNQIQQAISLQEFRSISMKEALEKGALALFGEKYGEQVRAIKFGDSIELCGGTHVENTQSIWHFKIINESAIAAGIRRIEAITGSAAKRYFTGIDQELLSIKKSLKNPKNPLKAVEELTLENTALKKKLEDFQKQQLASLVNEFSGELQTLNGIQFLIKEVNVDSKMAKELAFQLGAKHKNVFLLFGFENDGKAGLTCYVSKELAQEKKLHANEFIKELSTHINGSGGGQPFFASAGGTNPTGISIALGIAEKKLEEF